MCASAGLAKVLLLHAGAGCMACVPGLHVVVLLVGDLAVVVLLVVVLELKISLIVVEGGGGG